MSPWLVVAAEGQNPNAEAFDRCFEPGMAPAEPAARIGAKCCPPESTDTCCKCLCPCAAVLVNQGTESWPAVWLACLFGPLYTVCCWTPRYSGSGGNIALSKSTGCVCCCPCCAVGLNQGTERKCDNVGACLLGPLYTFLCWSPLYNGAQSLPGGGISNQPVTDMER